MPAAAQTPPTASPGVVMANWLGQASDIPVDPTWRLGTLPNGLRYAVRRSSQPAGTIAVRVRVGVGGLMEADNQQGWSHLLEHMVFRGTARYADGEGMKLWERLGATFGSDTNAATTLTSTTFQLDLPRADPASYATAMSVLADMMDTAKIDPALLATERQVVGAEAAQRLSPLARKLRDAQQPLFYAGTRAATRDVIGTARTLGQADASTLKAYYEAWYRPDNAVVVVAGDADPALLEAEVRRAFGGWKAEGEALAAPDWGAPVTPASPVVTLADAQLPDLLLLGFVAPHLDRTFDVARQQEQFAERVAIGILNQRFAAAAQRGAAFVNVSVQLVQQRRIADQVLVQIGAKSSQSHAALNQAYAVLNGVVANPPAQAEIDQQAAGLATWLQQRAASASTQTGPALANSMIAAVESADVVASPDYYAKLFAAQRPSLTPVAVQAVLKRLLAPAPRLFVAGPQPVPGGIAAMTQALAAAQKVAGGATELLRAVSLDQLILGGKPATVTGTTAIPSLNADIVRFSNGVELVFKHTEFDKDRVLVRVQVGRGLLGEPRGDLALWWTAPALTAAGVGPFSPDELARAAAGRQVGFVAQQGLDALILTGATNGADLGDMLKLVTGALQQPRFDAVSVARVRDATLANYASIFSQPVGVLQAFGGAALHGGDDRFLAIPPKETIASLSLPAFRQFWTERLGRGPLRIVVVGDVDRSAVVAAVAHSLGTLGGRRAAPAFAIDVQATPPATPVMLRHKGDPGQALVMRAFPTLGFLEQPATSAALDLTTAIVQARLTEGFRASEGSTYSPLAAHSQSSELPRFGVLVAGAQVQATRIDGFERSLDAVLADLAAKGPTADEFGRAQTTAISAAERNRENNGWWVGVLGRELSPDFVSSLAGSTDRLKGLTAASVQRVTARYLTVEHCFTIKVLPEVAH